MDGKGISFYLPYTESKALKLSKYNVERISFLVLFVFPYFTFIRVFILEYKKEMKLNFEMHIRRVKIVLLSKFYNPNAFIQKRDKEFSFN